MPLFLPDANILINALRRDAKAHDCCRGWLLESASKGHEIGLCELVETALLRICTLRSTSFADMSTVIGFWQEDLWSYPRTRRLGATAGQNRLFVRFITDLGLAGNDINDAWLAALAVEHQATLVSLDGGFARFAGLRWLNPATF